MSQPLTFFVDNASVRVFQSLAGESLDALDRYEVWDIITVLSQAVSLAAMNNWETINTDSALEVLNTDVEVSKDAEKCLDALNGFPAKQVNLLMIGILNAAFNGGFDEGGKQ